METLQIVTIFFIFAKLVIFDYITAIAPVHFHSFNTQSLNMAKEIERKFLVVNKSFINLAKSYRHIRQAYLSTAPKATVRLRIIDDEARMTIKGRNNGAVRDEWEYAIPVADAEEMAARLTDGFSIDKTRYIVNSNGWTWEIDVFHGKHSGLIVAEIEMPSADCNPPIPDFIGEEVTNDSRYYNSMLSLNPGIPDRKSPNQQSENCYRQSK